LGGERIESPSCMATSCKTLRLYFPENKEVWEISPNGTRDPSSVTAVRIAVFQRAYKMNQLNFKAEVTAHLTASVV